jgi:hypothetical protein
MARKGKGSVLDETKKAAVLGMIAAGCSRRVAAAFVGCSPATVRRAAQRDPEFAERLRNVSCVPEVGYLKNIKAAAEKPQYWRAAAWALERLNPEDFGRRIPEMASVEEIRDLLTRLAELLVGEIPDPACRKRVLKRIARLKIEVRAEPQSPRNEEDDDEEEQNG